jgi:hypothetical protein
MKIIVQMFGRYWIDALYLSGNKARTTKTTKS